MRARFKHLSFAGHFDTTMVGRRGITHYLAHNMTVTATNVEQIPDVIRECRQMGWRLFSHQPAAFIGNPTRWQDDFRELTNERVWDQIGTAAGVRLPYKAHPGRR